MIDEFRQALAGLRVISTRDLSARRKAAGLPPRAPREESLADIRAAGVLAPFELVSHAQKFALACLYFHAHADGTSAYPRQETVAAWASCSPRHAERHMKELVADGWVRHEGYARRDPETGDWRFRDATVNDGLAGGPGRGWHPNYTVDLGRLRAAMRAAEADADAPLLAALRAVAEDAVNPENDPSLTEIKPDTGARKHDTGRNKHDTGSRKPDTGPGFNGSINRTPGRENRTPGEKNTTPGPQKPDTYARARDSEFLEEENKKHARENDATGVNAEAERQRLGEKPDTEPDRLLIDSRSAFEAFAKRVAEWVGDEAWRRWARFELGEVDDAGVTIWAPSPARVADIRARLSEDRLRTWWREVDRHGRELRLEARPTSAVHGFASQPGAGLAAGGRPS